jgi:hypothetical protein
MGMTGSTHDEDNKCVQKCIRKTSREDTTQET